MAAPGKLSKYMGVDGEGRQTSIELPEWALEATQAKCFAKLEKVAKSLAKGGDNYNLLKDVKLAIDGNAEAINKLASNSKKTGKTSTTTNNKSNQNDTGKAADALADAAKGQNNALMKLKKLADKNKTSDGGNILTGLAGKAGPFAIMGNMIGKVVGVLAKFVGAIVAATVAVATFIGTQLMKVFNLMNDSLSDGTAGIIGALTTGSTNIATQASLAGLGLRTFTEALQESSEEIAVLGAEGYKDLRNATRDMTDGLFDMGFKNDEITKLLGREISIRARLGMRLDAEGTNLATDVVKVAKHLREIGAAAGISAEELYARSKLDDETNSLIAARAREFGDDGISALQTSIRILSLKMVGISPTYASAITTPLVNAVITGAVGLDDNFTELVSVFPGLVKSFDMAKNDINNSGELSANTIENIMSSLVDTTDEEFKRAKQLALMTRNQTAIQAVNFASEARARRSLISDVTKAGSEFSGRNIAVISAQADTFFDMMKAPFENAVTQFTMGVLGVSSTGEGANFGTLITKFSYLVEDFLASTKLFGDLFVGSGFFARFNKQIEAYFDAGTGTERADAAKALQNMFIEAIDKFSASIGDASKQGVLGQMITNMFRNLMDQIVLAIYEGSDGRFFKESAGEAYIRAGRFNEARAMNDKGLVFGGTEGQGAHHGVVGLFDQYMNNEAAMADKFGIKTLDFQKVGNPMLDTDPKKRTKLITDLKKKYPHMTDKDIEVLFKAAGEMRGEMTEMMRQYDLLSKVTYNGRVYEQINIDDLAQRFKDGDRKLDQFLQYYAQNKNIVNSGLQESTFADFNPATNSVVGGVTMLPEAINQLDVTIDTVRNHMGSNGITAGTVFKSVVTELIRSTKINVNDGIDDREKQVIQSAVQAAFLEATNGNMTDPDTKANIDMLIASMNRLTFQIAEPTK